MSECPLCESGMSCEVHDRPANPSITSWPKIVIVPVTVPVPKKTKKRKATPMTDQRMVTQLQEIIDNNDCVEAMRIIVGQLKAVFDRHDGIHPSPYTNHVTALALALEEVHQS